MMFLRQAAKKGMQEEEGKNFTNVILRVAKHTPTSHFDTVCSQSYERMKQTRASRRKMLKR